MLGERELVEEVAGNRSRGDERRPVRARRVEPVDHGFCFARHLRRRRKRVDPALCRHIEALLRAVDELRIGHDRRAFGRIHAAVEVDRKDRQHPLPREARRTADGRAGDDGSCRAMARDEALEAPHRHPSRGPRAQRRRRDRARRRGDHEPRRAAVLAGVDECPFDRHLARHLHRRGVGRVHFGERRAFFDDARRADRCRADRSAEGHRDRSAPGDDEHPAAADQELGRVAVWTEGQRADEMRSRLGRDGEQGALLDREDRRAVALDDVRLFHAGLLVVGGREGAAAPGAFGACPGRRGRALDRGNRCSNSGFRESEGRALVAAAGLREVRALVVDEPLA